jgi:predicted transcriptional regulator of viral defense system
MKIDNKYRYIFDSLPNEFSTEQAQHLLNKFYKAPNKHLELLVASGQLIRLKKGLFVPAERYDPLAAAASIHGPSYLSFETALGFYGMIPESVSTIFSVVDARQLRVEAAGHLYIYRSQQRELFAQGMTAVNLGGRNVLIATKEKALLDTIAWSGINTKQTTQSELFDSICESYRFNDEDLHKLSRKQLAALATMYRSLAPRMFSQELAKRKVHGR